MVVNRLTMPYSNVFLVALMSWKVKKKYIVNQLKGWMPVEIATCDFQLYVQRPLYDLAGFDGLF